MSQALTRLKSATQSQHDLLETVSFAREIMSQRISRSEYIQLLNKTAVIYRVLEPTVNAFIDKYPTRSLISFISNRLSKVEKDLTDLNQLETQNSSIHSNQRKIEIKQLPDLIGVLYVLEGARLGGKVIVKALHKNPALADITAFHFYQQDGINTRQRWLSFRTLADEYLVEEQDQKRAAQSALKTFEYFYNIHRIGFSF